ncbi:MULTISPECIES: thioredoxin [Henriciella]|jgi:thioredoxin 1|uniref:Thioredoxin n=1 Tax=Henriciella pelagia TaxID=1977912 RepID=A0ABQ1JP23_9PROT|nr:thioredoxin [Henriciella pelagia]GGB71248.1 thioredoxin [Henriciella pelagia]
MATENITDDNFDEAIAGDLPVVVDFWAEWCGPCKQMAPHLESVAEELAGKVKITKINVDENPVAPSKFGVRGMPTLMLFKDGKVAATHLGAMSKQRLTEWIKESA